MADWQPIEAAPRDGTWVLISGGTLRIGNSDPTEHEYTGVGIAAYSQRRQAWERDGATWLHLPTHWMPLPEPPETDDDQA